MNTKDEIKITYPDRALMLRLPELLLWAHGTLTPPDDWPEGATLGSAWRLEAVYAGVSALAADPEELLGQAQYERPVKVSDLDFILRIRLIDPPILLTSAFLP